MVGTKKTSLKYICVAVFAAIVSASCSGSSSSAGINADEQPEPTARATELEPTKPPGPPSSLGTEPSTPNTDGGVVPEVGDNAPPGPTKPQNTEPKPAQNAEPRPAKDPPKDNPTPPPVQDDGKTSALERELADLTNELRANPNGRLRRSEPVSCGQTPINPATGQARPAPALTFNGTVSAQMARDWSRQLTWDKVLSPASAHRPNQDSFYNSLGISPMYWAENVLVNPSPTATAMAMFIQWRDSDAHYCNLMNPKVTHIGVGIVVKDSSRGISTFATQNFYTPF